MTEQESPWADHRPKPIKQSLLTKTAFCAGWVYARNKLNDGRADTTLLQLSLCITRQEMNDLLVFVDDRESCLLPEDKLDLLIFAINKRMDVEDKERKQ